LSRLPVLLGVAAVVCLVALLGYALVAQSPDTTIDSRLATGRSAAAPGFALKVLQPGTLGGRLATRMRPALADGRISLSELRGLPVVLNFWASWCPPCRTEAPLLERSWEAARPAGVLFVGLNMQDVTGDARDFLHSFHTSYLNVRDPTDDVSRRWGVTGLPETFFISAQGRVVDHVIGAVSPSQLAQGMTAARSGRPRGAQQGGARQSTR
jgi:cytochrome c biogenesis protein CcmG/thiol:disulfide interchange protein DsbE